RKARFRWIALWVRISRRLVSQGPFEIAGFSDLVSSVRFPILFMYSLRDSVAISSGKFPENERKGQCVSQLRGITCSMVSGRSTRTFSVFVVQQSSLRASRIMRAFDRFSMRKKSRSIQALSNSPLSGQRELSAAEARRDLRTESGERVSVLFKS